MVEPKTRRRARCAGGGGGFDRMGLRLPVRVAPTQQMRRVAYGGEEAGGMVWNTNVES